MRAVFNHHLDEDQLELYALGQLPASELDGVENHLLICESCRQHLEETEEFIRVFRKAARELEAEAHQPSWWRQIPRRVAQLWPVPVPARLVAVVAVAVLVVVVFIPRQREPVSPVTVTLESLRSSTGGASVAPAGVPFTLQLDARGLPEAAEFTIQIVDRMGREVWQGNARRQDGMLLVEGSLELDAGLYWVRTYPAGSSRELLREYRLECR